MAVTHEITNTQPQLWNGAAGRGWADAQELLDKTFKPFEDLLVETVSARPRRAVLDVGCGAGGVVLAIARRLGPSVHCAGVDISQPLIDAARRRAGQDRVSASFICADAQIHAFEPAHVDAIVSRFGVMFFDDPVRAFANLRRAARADAELRFIAWRSAEENPFMTTAERAAAPLLPNLQTRRPDAPGQFAFANDRRVGAILEESGWTDIEIAPIDVECSFPEAALTLYLTRLGPVGRMLQEADDRTRAHVVETVRTAFDPCVVGSDVRFTAACWTVGARSPR